MATSSSLALSALALMAISLGGCTFKSDSEYFSDQRNRAREQNLRDMRLSTRQTPRGTDLAGDALVAALADKTLVKRYPNTSFGSVRVDYVVRRYFVPDGRLILSEEPYSLHSPSSFKVEHRWRVDGERLCLQEPPAPEEWRCYRLARAADGELQWFIDRPGDDYDGLIIMGIREILDGPPGSPESADGRKKD